MLNPAPCIVLVWSVNQNVVDFCTLVEGFSFLLLYNFLKNEAFCEIRTLLEAKYRPVDFGRVDLIARAVLTVKKKITKRQI